MPLLLFKAPVQRSAAPAFRPPASTLLPTARHPPFKHCIAARAAPSGRGVEASSASSFVFPASAGDKYKPSARRSSQSRSRQGTSPSGVERLAAELLDKECEIKDVFTPGRSMPKASVVNKMRAEAKALREQLGSMLASGGAALQASASQEIASLLSNVAAVRARASVTSVRTRMSAPALTFEAESSSLSEAQAAELAALEAENAQLRARANALLARQHFLEAQMVAHNLQLPDGIGGTIDIDNDLARAPASTTKDPTYAMSAPSYY